MVVKANWDLKPLEKLKKEIKGNLITIGRNIRDEAKRLCPKESGRLRSSLSTNWSGSGMARASGQGFMTIPIKMYGMKGVLIRRKSLEGDGVGQPTAGPNEFVVVVGTSVEYAPYVCFGTAKKGPRPFLRPAWHKYREQILAQNASATFHVNE